MRPFILFLIDNLNSLIHFRKLTGNIKGIIGTSVDNNDRFPFRKVLFLQGENTFPKVTCIII